MFLSFPLAPSIIVVKALNPNHWTSKKLPLIYINRHFTAILLFIYLWLHWVFVAARAFFCCGERGLLSAMMHGLPVAVASH